MGKYCHIYRQQVDLLSCRALPRLRMKWRCNPKTLITLYQNGHAQVVALGLLTHDFTLVEVYGQKYDRSVLPS